MSSVKVAGSSENRSSGAGVAGKNDSSRKCGARHVAIYVGDGMMIHCGNPIQYASINSSYWQAHFYCFGRLS